MISKLKTELATGNYDGMSDQEVADALNDLKIIEHIEYMLTDIRLAATLGTVKAVAVVSALKANTEDPVSQWIVEKLATTGLDIGNAEAPALVAPLVTAEVVSQAEADKVLALGTRTINRAQQIGIVGQVKAIFVTEARK